MDCEKTGGPTKQVERRGRTKSGPIDPDAFEHDDEHKDEPLVADFGVSSVERYAALRLCGESPLRFRAYSRPVNFARRSAWRASSFLT